MEYPLSSFYSGSSAEQNVRFPQRICHRGRAADDNVADLGNINHPNVMRRLSLKARKVVFASPSSLGLAMAVVAIIYVLLSGCSTATDGELIKVIRLYGDSYAIVKRDDDGFYSEFLVDEKIVFHCVKGDNVFGYRTLPFDPNDRSSKYAAYLQDYSKNLGAFSANKKTGNVSFNPNLSLDDVKLECDN